MSNGIAANTLYAERTEDVPRWEGYRVRSPDGHLGFVQKVERDAVTGSVRLEVRAGRIVVLAVAIEDVEAVFPEEEVVLVRSQLAGLVSGLDAHDRGLRGQRRGGALGR